MTAYINTAMKHTILQYNTDGFHHGRDYFNTVTTNVDYALFQRLPIEDELSGPNIAEIHLERSISHSRDCSYIGITRFNGQSKFESCESFDLPSSDLARATKDDTQGSKALCTVIDKIQYCSVLPTFPNGFEGGSITSNDTLKDIEFLLNKLKNHNCIIAGDFHHKPGDFPELDNLIKESGFTSYLDQYDTFYHPEGNRFNLDRMISNISGLSVSNIQVHQPTVPSKHLAITYDVTY